ncbi:SIMPL domain-containing protein [Hyphococcus flavus]|uniref:SIMPL domain-containing protein n=1 Tax=Hyphococcus flavus TaxID=1866326 RepID=A0AAE9ZA98_9PROT|nr:SIMPL domain-containing protein [Hyphococcus flavus]WDI30519.1 SIMPL domain-containing protein [Hyphococcus flavus]
MRHLFIPAAAAMVIAGCAAPQAIAAEDGAMQRTITVNGQGRAAAAPDMAVISIGVQSEAKTAAEALRKNSTDMSATITKLKELGVADRDIQTSGLSINPRYNYDKNRSQPEVIGFTASNSVTVKLRDLDNAGAVIDQAVQSGANSLGGVSFSFSNPKPLQEDARRDAVADAKAKAELLTDAAGVRLGALITIQDGYVSSPQPRPYAARMEMAADSAVPMEAGESEVNATVTLVYEIQ